MNAITRKEIISEIVLLKDRVKKLCKITKPTCSEIKKIKREIKKPFTN